MAAVAPQPSSGTAPIAPAVPMLTEVPVSLKQLARLVVRGFYPPEEALIVDMLVRYPCVREEDLAELLKFDRKMLRARVSTLKSDKFIMIKQRIETDEDGKVVKMNCYYINFKVFVNIVKYKLDLMRKKMETSERDATSRSSFRCTQCTKTFTDLEADQLFDPFTMDFKCTFCSSPVVEDESAGPKKDSRHVMATFNEQMERLFDLLKIVENVQLAPAVLEPEPMVFTGGVGAAGASRGPGGPDGKGDWANNRSGGFRNEENQVKITIGDEEEKKEKAKEVPIWISQSTVGRSAGDDDVSAGAVASSVALESMVASDDDDDGGAVEQNDEITSLLLRHERKSSAAGAAAVFPGSGGGKGKSKKNYIPGAGSGSDSDKSDESDPEPEATAFAKSMGLIDAAAGTSSRLPPMPSATSSSTLSGRDHLSQQDESAPGSAVMSSTDDDDDDGDIPTVKVGGEDFAVTDVNEELKNRMTAEEKERYTQIFQDFYSHMYD